MLVAFNKADERHFTLSYQLLIERYQEAEVINLPSSLKLIPSYSSHKDWLNSVADQNWYFYSDNGILKGTVFMRHGCVPNEIGIYIFSKYRGQGIGAKALAEILGTFHGITVYAMINNNNVRSQGLFKKLGFTQEDEIKWRKDV